MTIKATTKVEPRKIAVLAALLVVMALVLYFNVFAGDSPSTTVPVAMAPASPSILNNAQPKHREIAQNNNAEFKPRQGAARPEDRPDPASIDPTLRLDLLAKVQNVEPEVSFRNVFQYGTAPPPPSKPIELPKNVPTIAINRPPVVAPPPGPPPVPVAPQMTFKYYGYKVSKANGRKQAFLLDGDDIIIAGENDPVKGARYKVVRIGISSITIEDTQFKSSQTLPMQQEETIG